MQVSGSTSSQHLQPRLVPVKDIRIAAVRVLVAILPDGIRAPATGDGSRRAAVTGKHERASTGELVAVARAGRPPVGRGVDHRVAARGRVVGVDEVLDPAHHGRLAEAIALVGSRRVVLYVQHPRESDAVLRPPAAVREEELGLLAAGALVRMREVIPAANESGIGGTSVVRREARIDVGGAFGGLPARISLAYSGVGKHPLRSILRTHLDNHKPRTRFIRRGKVDGTLIARDVEALHRRTSKADESSRYEGRSELHDG